MAGSIAQLEQVLRTLMSSSNERSYKLWSLRALVGRQPDSSMRASPAESMGRGTRAQSPPCSNRCWRTRGTNPCCPILEQACDHFSADPHGHITTVTINIIRR